MNGKDVLTQQFAGSFNIIAERLASADAARFWEESAFDGANPVGFTLWHCARTIDWGVQCAIRGVDEVARRTEWTSRMPARFRFGAGVSADATREIAAQFAPTIVGEYLEAVRSESLGWLAEQSDTTLDTIPEFRKHNELVEGYTDAAVWAEIDSLDRIPAWQILTRPCIGHIRTHIGEIDTLIQSLSRY